MPFGATFGNDLAKLIFQAAAIANIADNAASSPLTNLYVSLHTANPISGNQTTSEAAYTGYARQPLARSSGGFTVTGEVITLAAGTLSFPIGTAGGETCTYAAIGSLVSGTGKLLAVGALSPSLVTGNTITPQIDGTSTFTLV